MDYEKLRVREFPENESGSREILHCIFYRDPGNRIPGSRDRDPGMKYVPGAEFAKQGGPKSEMVYSIMTKEKIMNDYINQ